MDLRERVVTACDARDGTREQIAARFSVSVSWIRDLLSRRRQTGSIAPAARGGGHAPAFDRAAAVRLREAIRADDDATLAELAGPRRVVQAFVRVSGIEAAGHVRGKKAAAGGRAGPRLC